MARQVLTSRRVFPANQSSASATTTTLSILDATVTRFSPCAAIWLYDSANNTQLFDALEQSLSHTLTDYPHFAGQLRWARGPRPGRPQVTYGCQDDPGVELVRARYHGPLPAPKDDDDSAIWLAPEDFSQDNLLAEALLAFVDLARYEGLPGVSVQLTELDGGGWAVGVRMTHCLGDATCLVEFVKRWAAKTRALARGPVQGDQNIVNEALAKPIFDPGLLDRHTAGDLTLPSPDPETVALARALPMHRYDWWDTDAPGCPSWAKADAAGTKSPNAAAQDLAQHHLSPSTPPPWLTWDLAAAVDHVQMRFSAEQVQQLKETAQTDGGAVLLSRLDALLAHLWLLINRARQLQESPAQVFLNISLGVRTRVVPPLPSHFVGSPLVIGHVASTGQTLHARTTTLGGVAVSIRQMMGRFTPEAVAAHLHDAAYEASPQRLWQGFLGARHTLVTAWTRAGVYEVDFVGDGKGPRYAQARMPRMDGLLQVMDVGETGGFDVSLCLEREAMRRLLTDEKLWP